ncbi:DeoR/GlpR transcriptional regulator [Streptomyces clavuligerus]|uniref:Lactose phosphotransferase system repressor n=1 Tax=Streptomyces clavuligerus TaxID=1901 RepID=B5GZ84_STRCL|nr:DeoR/GlpR transcriptional regulator [Streptomyces clavuligerus]EDY51630.1 transcriptional regulator [Streptomyces clavuligerus]EFG06599.1 DeoR family transcriptional regulator [Streptomyces clavuligerus]QCS07830.1 DeoR/GlpR transcriptional regulator [Streptomyces clavuligerus]QPJ92828.1 DeoR family transcriptional regulator [Streptomyces clavuligerus]
MIRSEERHQRLLAEARRRGRVEVTALASDFGVAPETIRRDLSELERRGLVRRTHGGAYPVESAGFETSLAQRVTMHVENKRRIAAEAVKHLGGAETVFIDEGYTPQLLAALLPTDRPLTVVTASLPTAAAVAESANITVLLLGGRVRARTLATVGAWACQMLDGFVIDLAYIGANGISREHGLTTPDSVVADVKAKAIKVSRRRVFMGHHGKFGAGSFCRFADVTDFEAIITDTGLSSAEAHRYSLLGPQVVRV